MFLLWKDIYLIAFLGGLAIAVYSMLHGAERWRRKRSASASAVFNPPTVAALLTGFGMCGYLLVTRSRVGPLSILIIALVTAAAAFSGMTVLMAKWALRNPINSMHSEEEEINGQVATVTRAILPGVSGEITYFAWDRKHVLSARSIDDSEISPGTEVVIDCVEDGIARVELWSVVELRL